MKRTVRLATLALDAGKRAELRSVITTYAEVKRGFVRLLHSSASWRHLDDKRGFRDWAKAEGFYPEGVNVHLLDQATFDAVDSCIRHIESCVAIADIKARIWRRHSDEDERHYAYGLGEHAQRVADGLRSTLTAKDASPVQGRRSQVAKRCSSLSPEAVASRSKSATR